MYKIEAILKKAGSTPVLWSRFSQKPMAIKECLQLITPSSQGKVPYVKIEIIDFRCIQIPE